MALKALMLKRQIEQKEKELEALREKSAELETREAELEKAIAEAETDEERSTVEEEVENFENEKSENDESTRKVEEELDGLKEELKAEEDAQVKEEPKVEEPALDESREVVKTMETREKMTIENIVERENVKEFLGTVREHIKSKRAITNIGLTMPEEFLPLLQEIVRDTSKLLSRVHVENVSGHSREVVMGSIPEGIWTEMCANLNELDLVFNNVEVDGYKIGGFFAVCNAALEDNNVQLAQKVVNALGKGIGKGLDKAIVYGKGVKMPLGFVTRLAQEKQPADYPATARPWVDLHETNVIAGTGATGIDLFTEIVLDSNAIFNDYYENGITWIMNKKTHNQLLAESMNSITASSIVAGMNNSMPVIGGDIVELPFMADGDIAFGYLDAYLLAQRAGTQIASSEHARFTQDQTVFKGTARYDGTPVIAEAFGILNIGKASPTTSVDFPEDKAN